MRLGVIVDRLDPAAGGAEAHTDALVRRALAAGDEVAVATLEGDVPAGALRVPVPTARGGRPRRDRALADDGEKALRAAGSDVVYAVRHALRCDVYLPHGGLVGEALAAREAAEGPPGLLARLFSGSSAKRRFFFEAERALLAARDGPRVIALSNALAARIARAYPAAKARTTVIPNGVDSDRFDPEAARSDRDPTRRRLGVPGDAYVGLFLAHAPWLKGLDAVLGAMARSEVVGLTPSFHLIVAGKRASGEVEARARALGVGDRVHAAGPAVDPRPLYAAADVLVHPTFYDPCSLVCLEALSMALPVVTTPVNGAWELMAMRGGIAVERPGDAEGVAVALRVLADTALRAATAEDARYVARKNRLATRLDQVLAVCRAAVRQDALA